VPGPVDNAWVMWKRLSGRIGTVRRQVVWRAVHWGWQQIQRAGMITPDTPTAKAFRQFGAGTIMTFPVGSVFGEEWITIGRDTLIGDQVTISAGLVPGHDLGPDTVLSIGDRCVIGRGSHIVAHQRIEIGDDVWTGPYVYITDQNHGYADPDIPIGRQMPVNKPVSIGTGSWLGAGAIVLPGARIGRNVVIAAGSVVRGEVPDHCVVAGVPARVVRQHTVSGWEASISVARVSAPDLDGPPAELGPR
jgi:acetyltransferase-like isoleucine patch superfamily enzyme